MFKLVITLLLLKMVLAIVFESYKTVAGKQSKQTKSVGSDIDELGAASLAASLSPSSLPRSQKYRKYVLTHTHITCCCYEIKGTQDLKICSHADSLILSLAVTKLLVSVWTLLDWIGHWRESSSYVSPDQIKTITKDAESLRCRRAGCAGWRAVEG